MDNHKFTKEELDRLNEKKKECDPAIKYVRSKTFKTFCPEVKETLVQSLDILCHNCIQNIKLVVKDDRTVSLIVSDPRMVSMECTMLYEELEMMQNALESESEWQLAETGEKTYRLTRFAIYMEQPLITFIAKGKCNLGPMMHVFTSNCRGMTTVMFDEESFEQFKTMVKAANRYIKWRNPYPWTKVEYASLLDTETAKKSEE